LGIYRSRILRVIIRRGGFAGIEFGMIAVLFASWLFLARLTRSSR
jgi:hypothetical protein